MGRYKLESSGSGCGSVEGSCEFVNVKIEVRVA
jgi:hypothetical protein